MPSVGEPAEIRVGGVAEWTVRKGEIGADGVCLASHGAQGGIRYNLEFPQRLKPVMIGRTCGAA
jgi:hypothetical protein